MRVWTVGSPLPEGELFLREMIRFRKDGDDSKGGDAYGRVMFRSFVSIANICRFYHLCLSSVFEQQKRPPGLTNLAI